MSLINLRRLVMKSTYYLIVVFISLVILGCSSTYTIKDFSSKEKFYDDFNNSVKDRDVEITFTNDSSFASNNGVAVEGDSLYSLNLYVVKANAKISLSQLKEINYAGNNNTDALLTLKDGEKLQTENIQPGNDTLTFIKVSALYAAAALAPLDKLKTVSYKNRLWGMPEGFLIGIPTGYILGIMIGTSIESGSSSNQSGMSSLYEVFGPYMGAVIGAFTGWLIGRTYTYQFNP